MLEEHIRLLKKIKLSEPDGWLEDYTDFYKHDMIRLELDGFIRNKRNNKQRKPKYLLTKKGLQAIEVDSIERMMENG